MAFDLYSALGEMSERDIARYLSAKNGYDYEQIKQQNFSDAQINQQFLGMQESDYNDIISSRENDKLYGPFRKGLYRGGHNVAGSMDAMGALAGNILTKAGAETIGGYLEEKGMEGYIDRERRASLYPKETFSESPLGWALGTIGEQVPIQAATMGTSILSGGLGGAAALAGRKAVIEMAEGEAKKALIGKIKKEGIRKGAKTGATAAIFPLETGGTYGELAKEHNVKAPFSSMFYGALATALEHLPGGNLKIVDDLIEAVKADKGGLVKNIARGIAEGIPSEFVQEGGQELAAILNVVSNTDEELLTSRNFERTLESAVTGGFMGGLGGGLRGGIRGVRGEIDKFRKKFVLKDEQREPNQPKEANTQPVDLLNPEKNKQNAAQDIDLVDNPLSAPEFGTERQEPIQAQIVEPMPGSISEQPFSAMMGVPSATPGIDQTMDQIYGAMPESRQEIPSDVVYDHDQEREGQIPLTPIQTITKEPVEQTMPEVSDNIDDKIAAQEVNIDPTDAQKKAGNYKKAHTTIEGLDITIENPDGSVRIGVDASGNRWENTVHGHYGYFNRTEGKDGDQVDVFIKPLTAKSPKVFVIDQIDPDTGEFDEHKVVMGADSVEDASQLYLSNYEKGWGGLGNITEMALDDFKSWLKNGKRTKQPIPRLLDNQGRVTDGIGISPGDVFKTSSGGITTPYPKSIKNQDKKNTLKQNQWLIDNAIKEAERRGDEFNLITFKDESAENLPLASIEAMTEYLFGTGNPISQVATTGQGIKRDSDSIASSSETIPTWEALGIEAEQRDGSLLLTGDGIGSIPQQTVEDLGGSVIDQMQRIAGGERHAPAIIFQGITEEESARIQEKLKQTAFEVQMGKEPDSGTLDEKIMESILRTGTANKGDVHVKIVPLGDGFGVETTVKGDRRWPTEAPMSLPDAQSFALRQLDNPRPTNWSQTDRTLSKKEIVPPQLSGREFQPGTKGFNATVEGQKAMATRGWLIAILKNLNKHVGGPYTEDQIENLPDEEIDIVRDYLIELQKEKTPKTQAEPAPVTQETRGTDQGSTLYPRGKSDTSQAVAQVKSELEKPLSEQGVQALESSKKLVILGDQEEAEANIKKLQNRGKKSVNDVNIKYSDDGKIQGFTDGDTVYLVADGIKKGHVWDVFTHEGGVHVNRLLLSDKNFELILENLDRWQHRDDETGQIVKEAFAKVPKNTNPKHRTEEALAYLVEHHPEMGIVRRFISLVKRLLVQAFGKPFVNMLTPADLRAMAQTAAKGMAREAVAQEKVASNDVAKQGAEQIKMPVDTGFLASMSDAFGVSEEQLAREYQAVVDRFKGTEKWMKAPNREKTNLNERQWVLTRTSRFKAWFGPHIENAAIDSLFNLRGDTGRGEMESAVISSIKNSQILDSVIGSIPIDVVDAFGGEQGTIEVLLNDPLMFTDKLSTHRNFGVSDGLSGFLSPSEKVIAVSRTKLDSTQPTASNAKMFSALHTLQNNLIAVGARLVFDRKPNGINDFGSIYETFFDTNAIAGLRAESPSIFKFRSTGIKGTPASSAINLSPSKLRGRFTNIPTELSFSSVSKLDSTKLANILHKLNYNTLKTRSQTLALSSKVVDENGEPMVVYHGTVREFTEFSGKNLKKNTSAASAGLGFFFSDRPNTATAYSIPSLFNVIPKEYLRKNVGFGQSYVKKQLPPKYKKLVDKYFEVYTPLRAKMDEVLYDATGKIKISTIKEVLDFVKKYGTPEDYEIMEKYAYDEVYEAAQKNKNLKPVTVKRFRPTFDIATKLNAYFGIWDYASLGSQSYILRRILERIADQYVEYQAGSTLGVTPAVYPVFLNLKKVKTFNAGTKNLDDVFKRVVANGKAAQKRGDDGYIIKNITDGGGKGTHFIVFDNKQIKSATGNTGAFDGSNPDIRYSVTAERQHKGAERQYKKDEDTIWNYAVDTFKGAVKYWGDKGDGALPDVSNFAHHFATTMYNAQKVGGTAKRVFDIFRKQTNWKYEKQRELLYDTDVHIPGQINTYRKQNKAGYEELNQYVIDRDVNAIGHIVRKSKNDAGEQSFVLYDLKDKAGKRRSLGTYKTEDEAWQASREIEAAASGLDEQGQESLKLYRLFTRKLYLHYAGALQEVIKICEQEDIPVPEVVTVRNGKEVKVNLEILSKEMGDRQGYYFPRLRAPGKFRVFGQKDGKKEHKYFDTRLGAAKYRASLDRKGYKTNMTMVDNLSEDIYQALEPLLAMQQTINKALGKISSKDKERVLSDRNLFAEMRGNTLVLQGSGLTAELGQVLEDIGGKFVDHFEYKDKSKIYTPEIHFHNIDEANQKAKVEEITKKVLHSSGLFRDMDLQFASAFAKEFDAVLKSRGSRARMLTRSDAVGEEVSRGYEEDLIAAMSQAGLAAAGGYAKGQIAQKATAALMGRDISWQDYLKENDDGTIAKLTEELDALGIATPEELERRKDLQKQVRGLRSALLNQQFPSLTEVEKIQGEITRLQREIQSITRYSDRDKANVIKAKLNAAKTDLYEAYQKMVRERSIQADKQPNIYKELTATLEDILRNEETSDRVIGTLKGLAVWQYLGFRVSSAFINVTNMVTGMPATLNGETDNEVSLRSAIKYMGIGMTEYVKSRTTGSKYQELFDEISRRGWDEPKFNKEAFTILQSKLGRGWNQTLELSMCMFGATEKMNRAASIAGAYLAMQEAHKKKGEGVWDHDAMMIKANEISDNGHGVYEKANRPYHMRGDNIGARVLQLAYVFQTFQHNYIQEMWRLFRDKRQAKAAAYMMLSPGIFGLGATLPVGIAKALFSIFGADDPEERLIQIVEDNFGGAAGNFSRYGITGIGDHGASLKGSLAIRFDAPESFLDVFGAPGSVVGDVFSGSKNLVKGHYTQALEQIAPAAVGNISKGIRESTQGVTTRAGKPVYWGNEQLKGDSIDMVLRVLSFNPTHIAKKKDIQRYEWEIQDRYKERKSDIYKQLRAFYSNPPYQRDRKELIMIKADIRDFNEEIDRRNIERLVSKITNKSIMRAIKADPPKRERLRITK